MFTLKRNYPKTPPGGWHFLDPSGVTIHGKDANDLIANVAAFRKQNSYAPGSPEYEVTLFYVEHFPDFVELTENAPIEADKTRTDNLYEWTNKLWKAPQQKLIPVKLAAKRIDTCMDCPYCVEWTASAGDPQLDLRKEIVRKLIVLSQGNYQFSLGYCTAYKVHAGLFVLLKEPTVTKVPDTCWLGKPDGLLEE